MSCTTLTASSTVSVVPVDHFRGSVASYLVTVFQFDIDAATLVATRVRANLTGATITARVYRRNDDGTIEAIITKTTALLAQIEILPQTVLGVDQPTKGQFLWKLVALDTSSLDISCCYLYDIWVTLADGRSKPAIERSPFCLKE